MATAPRYAGTTVAAAKTYVSEQLGADTFLRVFDLDGDGVVATSSADETAFSRAVCAAETEIDEALGASSGAPFTGTIPDSIREITALRCLWCAVRTRLGMSDAARAPYRLLYEDTNARLRRISQDDRGRIPEKGPSSPTSLLTTSVEYADSFWGDTE